MERCEGRRCRLSVYPNLTISSATAPPGRAAKARGEADSSRPFRLRAGRPGQGLGVRSARPDESEGRDSGRRRLRRAGRSQPVPRGSETGGIGRRQGPFLHPAAGEPLRRRGASDFAAHRRKRKGIRRADRRDAARRGAERDDRGARRIESARLRRVALGHVARRRSLRRQRAASFHRRAARRARAVPI